MKREERARQTKRRIMDRALAEFSAQGYRGASVNNIFDSEQGISKGIIYHYFASKDELFLACVEECFQSLKAYIQAHFHLDDGMGAQECLTDYFGVRMQFFRENPLYQRIFMESVFLPPEHLQAGIMERRQPMERLNLEILETLFTRMPLRGHLDRENTARLLIQFLNFMNMQCHGAGTDLADIRQIEEKNCEILDIFLNGILERQVTM